MPSEAAVTSRCSSPSVRGRNRASRSRAGGSPASDLAVAPDTVKAWIGLLESVCYCFLVHPWSRHVANAIRKQPKIYLWDWSPIADEGARNENFIASHLLKSVHWWTDSGLGSFDLRYVRDKQQHEVDFLVTRDNAPFMLVECKTSMKTPLSPSLAAFQKMLSAPYAFQVAMDGEQSGVDVLDFKGRPSRYPSTISSAGWSESRFPLPAGQNAGAVGDGKDWTPTLSVAGGVSGFCTIQVLE